MCLKTESKKEVKEGNGPMFIVLRGGPPQKVLDVQESSAKSRIYVNVLKSEDPCSVINPSILYRQTFGDPLL